MQLLVLRSRSYPSRFHFDVWSWATERAIFLSIFISILILLRLPLDALGIPAWVTADSTPPTTFVLISLGLSVLFYGLRRGMLPCLRWLGVAALWDGRYTGGEFLRQLPVYFNFMEKELFDKANRVELERQNLVLHRFRDNVLDDAFSTISTSIEGPVSRRRIVASMSGPNSV
jgi:hypothetical protein